MNNAIFLRAPPHRARSLLAARHAGTFVRALLFHPSIHPCVRLACYFRTIKVDFTLHRAFHHNGETSERKRLIAGIFNSCHSHCPHLSVPCLLAQLNAHNMVQCWGGLQHANAKKETMALFNGVVLLR